MKAPFPRGATLASIGFRLHPAVPEENQDRAYTSSARNPRGRPGCAGGAGDGAAAAAADCAGNVCLGTPTVTPFRGEAGVATADFSDDAADSTMLAAVLVAVCAGVAAAGAATPAGADAAVAIAGAAAAATAGAGLAAAALAARACSWATSRLRAADIGFGGGGALATFTLPWPVMATAIARLVDGLKTMMSISTDTTSGAMALDRGSVPSIWLMNGTKKPMSAARIVIIDAHGFTVSQAYPAARKSRR